jgi:hypothetical protein
MSSHRGRLLVCLLVLIAAGSRVFAQEGVPVGNWTVPPYTHSTSGGITTMTDVTPPRAFIGVQPCRVADTRGNGAPIQGGIFANSAQRTWDVTGICGIPAGADAISVNFTVVSVAATPAGAFLLAWPTGQAAPPTAIMTYGPGVTILSNAAIIPLGPTEQLNVNVSHSTHVIMDVNGYFSDTLGNPANSLRLVNNSSQNLFFAQNQSTSCIGRCGLEISTLSTIDNVAIWAGTMGAGGQGIGIFGLSSSSTLGSAGVEGYVGAQTGATNGVRGTTVSNDLDSAGVLGRGGNPTFPTDAFPAAGVRGNSLNTGVLGVSRNVGVTGVLVNSMGVSAAQGHLGYNVGPGYGVWAASNFGGTGAKYFVEPHPEKADMVIRYVSLEGNESGTYFRGRGKFQNGLATIEVPEDFRLVTDPEGLSVVATPIGPMATVSVASIGLDSVVLRGSRNVEFFYLVNGVRKTHKHLTPIGPGREYMPERSDAKMPLYLTEGQKQMLISNGTYNADGTVNMETAKRLGWDKEWEKHEKPSPGPTPD